jgi:hypothetical protein
VHLHDLDQAGTEATTTTLAPPCSSKENKLKMVNGQEENPNHLLYCASNFSPDTCTLTMR